MRCGITVLLDLIIGMMEYVRDVENAEIPVWNRGFRIYVNPVTDYCRYIIVYFVLNFLLPFIILIIMYFLVV